MTPFVDDVDLALYVGDALDVLRELPDESADCAATSPPFFRLRDYGMEGQIGLESSPDEWVAKLIVVFREVRRVLKPTGTLWVECGDSYAGSRSGPQGESGEMAGRSIGTARRLIEGVTKEAPGCKPKDLIGSPWLLAFALRADGWWLRQAIIWHKPNAMPESATDRCTTSHSYVFLLSKQARYFFDAEAISEPAEWARWGDQTVPKYEGTETASGWMQPRSKAELLELASGRGKQGETAAAAAGNDASARRYDGFNERWKASGRQGNGQRERNCEMRGFDEREDRADGRKNPRSVWTIPTQGFPEAHFATWPEALVERIIKAGCPEGGTVLDCFMGSGTTALVARRLGRKSIGIELNPAYAEMCARRLGQQSLLAETS